MLSRLALSCLMLALTLTGSMASASPPGRASESGWHGSAEFGAQLIDGNSRSESLSAALYIDWLQERVEVHSALSVLTSTVSLVRKRRNDAGDLILDEEGDPVLEVLTGSAHERLSLESQTRWYQSEASFLFADFEFVKDNPDRLRHLARVTTGFGRKLWFGENSELTAGLGVGIQEISRAAGQSVQDTIGYASLNHVYTADTGLSLSASADTDLDDDEPVAKLELAASYPITDGLELAVRYQMRYYRQVTNDKSPLASDRDSTTTINLEWSLF